MEAPYGSWTSPVDARRIAEGGTRLGWPQAAGEAAYWVEMRPTEQGRYVVMRRDPDGTVGDVTPPGVNARTLVHEYGGGMYVAFRDGHGGESVIFSDYADQRLYRQDLLADAEGTGGEARWSAPRPITPAPPASRAWRYADGRVTTDGRSLVCVRERHAESGVVNDLVVLPTDGSSPPAVVAEGHDFFAAPRLSLDGRLAYIRWDHPRMPWDGTELRVAAVDGSGRPRASVTVAGGESESVVQPLWTPGGDLLFISDRTGWWNLYRVGADAIGRALDASGSVSASPAQIPAEPVAPMAAEFAKPHWAFGLASVDLLPDGSIVAALTRDGADHFVVIGPDGVRELDCDYSVVAGLAAAGERVVVDVASATKDWQIALLDPRAGTVETVRRGGGDEIDERSISRPEPIAFPTWYEPDAVQGPLADELAGAATPGSAAASPSALQAHALYFPPANPDFTAPRGEKPPLLVISHGGPTAAHEANLTMDVQYWTSRGIAVVDVNYGGSSGYGRAYRARLEGNWGVVDTVDCIRAAEYLVARGDVDPKRLAIRGGSAGGYTTLNALTRFDTFAAGASHFGLADLERFVAGGTHKFEERYLFQLIGPYPEAAGTYRERSPIHHVDDIACPVILFQGLEDEIVPPEQAEMIVAALKRRGLAHAYLAFEGEQHGFRKAENVVRCLEAELYFYGKVFGFVPADEIEPVAIEGMTG